VVDVGEAVIESARFHSVYLDLNFNIAERLESARMRVVTQIGRSRDGEGNRSHT
jgi:hypothetical protein